MVRFHLPFPNAPMPGLKSRRSRVRLNAEREEKRMLDLDMMAEEFRIWLERHPDRVEAAHEALCASSDSRMNDLANLLGRALERD